MLPGAASSVRSIPNVSPYLGGRQGERFPFHINRDLSYFFFYRIYIVTVLSGAFPSLLGIVWRVSAAFLGDAVLNGTVRGMLWRACPSSKGKNHPSSPIVSRRAPSSLPRILRAAPGWSSAISANSLGWTSPIGRKEPSPPYWRSNAPADGVEPFRSPGHLASAYSVPPVPPYAKRKAFLCLRGRLSVSFDAGCAVIAPLRVFSCGG